MSSGLTARASRRRGAASTRTEIRSPQDPLWKIWGDVGAASTGTGTGSPQDPPCRNWGDAGPHPRQEPGLLKTRCGCFGRTRGRVHTAPGPRGRASVFLLPADSVPAASSRGSRSGGRCGRCSGSHLSGCAGSVPPPRTCLGVCPVSVMAPLGVRCDGHGSADRSGQDGRGHRVGSSMSRSTEWLCFLVSLRPFLSPVSCPRRTRLSPPCLDFPSATPFFLLQL